MFKLSFILSIFTCLTIQGQFEYTILTSEGKVPLDILKSTHQKVSEDQSDEIKKDDSKKVKKIKKDFLLKSNYMLDELLMSGRVVYGNKINKLINKVGYGLLSENNKDKIRFYVLKSNTVNAFSTNQGMIFITTGLLSRLENEAELAFILAHEIAHYTEKHIINKIIESDKVFSERKRLKYSSYDDNILKLSKYSKSLELEADSIGYVNYLHSGYDKGSAKSVFEKLKSSFMPFETAEVALEKINSKIPRSLLLEHLPTIDTIEESDSLSSHPNINLRIAQIIKEEDNPDGKKYVHLSPLEMDLIINSSKVAEIKLHLECLNYMDALYNSMCLSIKYPSEKIFKTMMAQSLYGIAKYANANKLANLFNYHENYFGNIVNLYYLFENLTSEQINIIAINYLDQLLNSDRNNQLLLDILRDLTHETCLIHNKNIHSFNKEFNEVTIDSIEYNFHKTILNNASSTLKEFFLEEDKVVKEQIALKLKHEKFLNDMSPKKRMKYLKKRQKLNYKYDEFYTGKIGADKIVYVDPDYMIIDERKGVKLINSEKANDIYIEQIQAASKASDLPIEIISPRNLYENNITMYNDLSIINGAFNEVLLHANNDIYNNFVLSSYYDLEKLRFKYRTDYFAYNGQIIIKNKKLFVDKVFYLLYSFLEIYTIPHAIIYAFIPDYDTYYYNMVLDINKGGFVTSKFSSSDVKSNYGRTCTILYKDMCLLKSKE